MFVLSTKFRVQNFYVPAGFIALPLIMSLEAIFS